MNESPLASRGRALGLAALLLGTLQTAAFAQPKSRHTLEGHTSAVWSVGYIPDGKTLASGSEDKTIKFWDVREGKKNE